MKAFGTNGRMTEMQAVIGRIQLRRMKDWIAARNANALAIRKALLPFTGEGGVVRLPELGCLDCRLLAGDSCSCVHAYYKYYAFVRPKTLLTAGHGINWWKRSTHVVCPVTPALAPGGVSRKLSKIPAFAPKSGCLSRAN